MLGPKIPRFQARELLEAAASAAVEDPAAQRLTIMRYRCLLRGPLDPYMRRAVTEMLAEEEGRLAARNLRDGDAAPATGSEGP